MEIPYHRVGEDEVGDEEEERLDEDQRRDRAAERRSAEHGRAHRRATRRGDEHERDRDHEDDGKERAGRIFTDVRVHDGGEQLLPETTDGRAATSASPRQPKPRARRRIVRAA